MTRDGRKELWKLSLDEWLFIAMYTGLALYLGRAAAAFLFGLLLIYLLPARFLPRTWGDRIRLALIAVLVAYLAVNLTVAEILARHDTKPYLHVHDGVIQVEESIKLLLAGQNPYGADYSNTPLAQWGSPHLAPFTTNPALYHNVNMPFMVVFSVPISIASNSVIGWFDERFVFLPMFLGILLLLAVWVKNPVQKRAVLLFLVLNSFVIPFVIAGRNDSFVLFWIVLSLFLLARGHEGPSLVALGLACASKMTSWILVPFYLVYLFQPNPIDPFLWLRRKGVASAGRALPLVLTAAAVLLPFFAWNPSAFIEDLWRYPNGTSAIAPYPVYGAGFGMLTQALGLVAPGAITSPYEFLGWVIGLPVFAAMLWVQLKHNNMAQMLFGFAVTLGVVGYFGHMFNQNHIGFMLAVLAISNLAAELDPIPAQQQAVIVPREVVPQS